MTDVFISYSRKDAEFVRRLHGVLSQLGRDIWVDWEDIPRGVDWLHEIHVAIEAADTFILVVSPDAMFSEICNDEIHHAFQHNKRIIPIVHREVDERELAGEWFEKTWEDQARENWRAVKHLNWLFFRDSDVFNASVQTLIDTIDTDIDHVQIHTRLLVRAREWEGRQRDESFLLTGAEIIEAQTWLADGQHKSPPPTALHRAYINTSRQAEDVRQQQALRLERQAASRLRYLVGVLVISLVIAVVLTLFSFSQFQSAQSESNTRATAQAQAETLVTLLSARDAFQGGDVFLGIALAMEADPIASLFDIDLSGLDFDVLAEMTVSPGPVAIFQDADSGAVTDVALSPDQHLALASYADGRLRLWDVSQGIGTFTTPLFISDVIDPDGINSVAFSADGLYAASAGCGMRNPDDNLCTAGQVILWEVVNEPQPLLRILNTVGAMTDDDAGSFDTRITTSEVNVIAFDPAPRNSPVRLMAGYSNSTEGPYGIRFESEGGTLRPFPQIFNQDGDHSSDVITSVAFSTNGEAILSGDVEGGIRLWSSGPSNRPFSIGGHSDRITSLSFNPSNTSGSADTLVLSSSVDGTVRLSSRNQDQGFFTFYGHNGPVNDAAFTPDGRLGVTAGADGNLFVIDLSLQSSTFGSVRQPLRPADGETTINALAFAFTPEFDPALDRQIFAVSGQADGSIILWDMTFPDSPPVDFSTIDDGDFPTDALVVWMQQNRFIRELSCDERIIYLLETECA